LFHFVLDAVPDGSGMNQRANYGAVPFAELIEDPLHCFAISSLGMRGRFDQFVSHATHGRDHHY
jgi:hypothetical protein